MEDEVPTMPANLTKLGTDFFLLLVPSLEHLPSECVLPPSSLPCGVKVDKSLFVLQLRDVFSSHAFVIGLQTLAQLTP